MYVLYKLGQDGRYSYGNNMMASVSNWLYHIESIQCLSMSMRGCVCMKSFVCCFFIVSENSLTCLLTWNCRDYYIIVCTKITGRIYWCRINICLLDWCRWKCCVSKTVVVRIFYQCHRAFPWSSCGRSSQLSHSFRRSINYYCWQLYSHLLL